MSKYCLSINILCDEADLLERLILTLETADGDLSSLSAVEVHTHERALSLPQVAECAPAEQGVALEQWFLTDRN